MSKQNPNRAHPKKAPKKSEPDVSQDPAANVPSDEALLESHQDAFRAADGSSETDSESRAEIEELRARLQAAEDSALRRQAELENYQKRVARQMEEERRYANVPLIRDLLPVWDNMGRAIEAAEKSHQTDCLLEGFKMTARQLEDVLVRHHCVRIKDLHEAFDPNRHEAISQQPSAEHPAGTVVQVTQIGFQMHDRVVRPSQVVVSAAVPNHPPPEQQTPPADPLE